MCRTAERLSGMVAIFISMTANAATGAHVLSAADGHRVGVVAAVVIFLVARRLRRI